MALTGPTEKFGVKKNRISSQKTIWQHCFYYRFQVQLPENYPDGDCPQVVFDSPVFHPHIDPSTNTLNVKQVTTSYIPMFLSWFASGPFSILYFFQMVGSGPFFILINSTLSFRTLENNIVTPHALVKSKYTYYIYLYFSMFMHLAI